MPDGLIRYAAGSEFHAGASSFFSEKPSNRAIQAGAHLLDCFEGDVLLTLLDMVKRSLANTQLAGKLPLGLLAP